MDYVVLVLLLPNIIPKNATNSLAANSEITGFRITSYRGDAEVDIWAISRFSQINLLMGEHKLKMRRFLI